jgi:hypothetical protein
MIVIPIAPDVLLFNGKIFAMFMTFNIYYNMNYSCYNIVLNIPLVWTILIIEYIVGWLTIICAIIIGCFLILKFHKHWMHGDYDEVVNL